MKLRLSHLLFFSALLFLVEGCLSPPDYPIEPKIDFLSFSKSMLDIQNDTFQLEFSFQDGDGDIGFESYDSSKCNPCNDSCEYHKTLSIFIKDNRTGCYVPYNVPYVPPKGSSEAISGKINVVMSTCCVVAGQACPLVNELDTVTYTVFMRDRANHKSNIIELPPVILKCDKIKN